MLTANYVVVAGKSKSLLATEHCDETKTYFQKDKTEIVSQQFRRQSFFFLFDELRIYYNLFAFNYTELSPDRGTPQPQRIREKIDKVVTYREIEKNGKKRSPVNCRLFLPDFFYQPFHRHELHMQYKTLPSQYRLAAIFERNCLLEISLEVCFIPF